MVITQPTMMVAVAVAAVTKLKAMHSEIRVHFSFFRNAD